MFILDRPLFNIGSDDEYIHTPFASFRRQSIQKQDSDPNKTYSTSIGSRIGVVYIYKQKTIHMHCILNGVDYGPFSILKIPSSSSNIETGDILISPEKRQRTCISPDQSINKYTKFWAFIDVYGATKRVRIVQLYGRKSFSIYLIDFCFFISFCSLASTLKSLCRLTIHSHLTSHDQINEFHIGNQLKSYLKFHSI